MNKAAESFVAEYDGLRLVITHAEDGWRVYAFEADETADDGMTRGKYQNLEAAKQAAFETASELFGYALSKNDLKWTMTVGHPEGEES